MRERGNWNGTEENGNVLYVVVEEVAMDSPIECVFEGTPVQDPNPLFLRRPPSKVRCRRCQAHPSLSLYALRLFLSLLLSVSTRCSQLNQMKPGTAPHDVVTPNSVTTLYHNSGPCWAFLSGLGLIGLGPIGAQSTYSRTHVAYVVAKKN